MKHDKSVLSTYTRRTVPEEWRNCRLWPAIDETSLDERDKRQVGRFRAAIVGYLAGAKVASLTKDFRVSKSEVLRALNRCLETAPDGRIQGWRALRPRLHLKPYERKAELEPGPSRKGLAGALTKLFHDHPEVQEFVDALALKTEREGHIHEPCIGYADLHEQFLAVCSEVGIPQSRYPFNTERQAAGTLQRYVRDLRLRHFERAAQILGGRDAARRARVGTGHAKLLVAEKPYDFVSNDAHRIDCIGSICIPHPKGARRVPIKRLNFLPVQDQFTGCVLGYRVVIGVECKAEDVVLSVNSALGIWRPRALRVPGMSYPEGAGLPSGLIPELAGAGWAALFVDSAAINLSVAVAERVRRRVGCAVNWGPVGQWYRRPLVECLFGILERRGFQRLPSTTGSHPKDPRRNDPAAKAVDLEVDYEDLLDLIDLAVATFNATKTSSLGMRSPLDLLREFVADPNSGFLPRALPPLPPGVPDLDVVVERRTVRGNVKEGRRPHIELDGVHYVNDVLNNAGHMIGMELIVHIRNNDYRTVEAFIPGGGSIGILIALGDWGRIKHDRVTRRAINSLKNSGELKPRRRESDVSCYMRFKGQQALEKTQGGRRTRISKEATELARLKELTGLPVPQATPDNVVPLEAAAQTSIPPRPLPEFLGRPKHKAVTPR